MGMRKLRRYLAAPVFMLVLLAISALPAVAAEPTVHITSPANGSTVAGPSVTVTWESSGVTIKPPAEATAKEEGHYHAFLDIMPDTTPGEPFPKGEGIVHTADTSTTFDNVAPGEHTVTLVLGYNDHSAWQPVVEDKVTFTVTEAAGQIAPASGQMQPNHKGPILLVVIAGLVIVLGGVVLRGRNTPTR